MERPSFPIGKVVVKAYRHFANWSPENSKLLYFENFKHTKTEAVIKAKYHNEILIFEDKRILKIIENRKSRSSLQMVEKFSS